jgi:hypothetical protein
VLIFPFPQLATAAVFKACMNADSQNGATATDSLRSPEDHEATLTSRIVRVGKETIPEVDLQDLLERVELIAYRFGAFEKVMKDPNVDSRDSYRTLLAIIAARGVQ